MKRRSLLGQILVIGTVPAIIRSAPFADEGLGLTVTVYPEITSDDELMPGVFLSGYVIGMADDYGCPVLVRNTNSEPVRFYFGQVLGAGEERIISKCLRPYPASWSDQV